jgi:hypothetical protein
MLMEMEIPKGSPSCFILLLEQSESLEYTLHRLFGRGRAVWNIKRGHTLTMPFV